MGSGRTRGVATVLGASAAIGLYATRGRDWIRRWGATEDETQRTLPGDDLLPEAVYETTHAIDINASPEDVWPWLVQMGQGRGGFYSYDWVEHLGGLDIQSADRLVPEYQQLAEGDIVRLAPHTGLVAAVVQPSRALVLRATADIASRRPPRRTDPGYFDWSWAFVVEPSATGSRLLIRLRADTAARPPFSLVGPLVWEPLHFLMERKMLRGIRERAERGGEWRDAAGSEKRGDVSADVAREAERVTTEDARRRSGAGGAETDAPSFADETGTTDLGVDEPALEGSGGGSTRSGDRGSAGE
jgi:hypothetical protein